MISSALIVQVLLGHGSMAQIWISHVWWLVRAAIIHGLLKFWSHIALKGTHLLFLLPLNGLLALKLFELALHLINLTGLVIVVAVTAFVKFLLAVK